MAGNCGDIAPDAGLPPLTTPSGLRALSAEPGPPGDCLFPARPAPAMPARANTAIDSPFPNQIAVRIARRAGLL